MVENCIDKHLTTIKLKLNSKIGKYQTPDESILRYMDRLQNRYDNAMDAIVEASIILENGSIAPMPRQRDYILRATAILDYQKCQDISFVHNLPDLET
jgi:hypothetical protein